MANLANSEIIQIAESVAREKGINMDLVLSAMENAIQAAGKRKYGQEQNIKAEISKRTGEIKLYRVLEVVENPLNYISEISLEDAIERNADSKIGDQILELLPPIDLGRVAAQSAKQIIVQKVRDAEREKQFEDFKDRVGEILGGVVKRIEFGDIIVELGRTEAVIKKDQQIKTEMFKINDRVKAYVADVARVNKGPQIFLSRTHNNFLAKLMELEIPEVYEGQIQIKSIARDPGSKAKVAVYSSDPTLDSVGSCIGIKGNRIKAVTNELAGEKIDVIHWSGDLAQFIVSSMSPAEISKVVIHEERKAVEIVVPTDQFSIAVGRRGQNVRLASQITGWHIEVMTDEQESKRRVEEFNSTTELFKSMIGIDEVSAQLLVSEGFSSIEQIAMSDANTLESLEGFSDETLQQIVDKASAFIEEKNQALLARLEHQGVEQDLLDTLGLPLDQLLVLAENGIKTLEDLAELDVKEFRSILPKLEATNEDIEAVLEVARSRSE
jgi:transcription termination/antitermination protein NusA